MHVANTIYLSIVGFLRDGLGEQDSDKVKSSTIIFPSSWPVMPSMTTC